MVYRVYQRALESRLLDHTVVATDDPRIADALAPLGVPVAMTRSDHRTGTDRVAEVAAGSEAACIVNIQGDEPLIDPAAIDAAIEPMLADPNVAMATLKKRIENPHEISDPHVVKVVTDLTGNAIYFSRSTIPYPRPDSGGAIVHFKHIGLYVYRRDFLLGFSRLPVGPLEEAEKLEQLRALENRFSITVVETSYESIGVDTPADLERVARLYSELTHSSNNKGAQHNG
jgi:3-deoxy-manno-octulosonate cytidylyltransferase (CMP-KDO synthetase)